MTGLPEGPLAPPWWVLQDIIQKASVNESAKADLKVLGLGGIMELSGARERNARWRKWIDRTASAIKNRDEAWTQKIRDHLIACSDLKHEKWANLKIDPVTRDIADHFGANPIVLALLMRIKQDLLLTQNGDPTDHIPAITISISSALQRGHNKPFLVMTTPLNGSVWEGSHIDLFDFDIPESIQIAIAGRPLREVVQNTLLDRHDMTIVRWDAPSLIIRHEGEIIRLLDWTPNGE